MESVGETGKGGKCQRLSACALGIAFGVVWALGVIVFGLIAWKMAIGAAIVGMVSSVYVGFAATPIGILIGAVWAFVDGFIKGVIIAWVYNKVLKNHHCKMCCPMTQDEK